MSARTVTTIVCIAGTVWVVGIPIAFGFILRGRWPAPFVHWNVWAKAFALIQAISWPLVMVLVAVYHAVYYLWYLVVLFFKSSVRELFRLGGWFYEDFFSDN